MISASDLDSEKSMFNSGVWKIMDNEKSRQINHWEKNQHKDETKRRKINICCSVGVFFNV